jgi:hypothetical protein
LVTSPAAILLMPCSMRPRRSGFHRLSRPMRLHKKNDIQQEQ